MWRKLPGKQHRLPNLPRNNKKKKTLQHQTQTKTRSSKNSAQQTNGPKVNKEHFPPLRRQATTVTYPWANYPTEDQVENSPSPQSTTHINESEKLTGFNELVDEINTLKSLCNIIEITRAIKDFNELLKKCKSHTKWKIHNNDNIH